VVPGSRPAQTDGARTLSIRFQHAGGGSYTVALVPLSRIRGNLPRGSPTVNSKCRGAQHRGFRSTKERNPKIVTRYRIFTIRDRRSEHEHGWLQMQQLLERARAYLDALEAERQMALTLSEQKARGSQADQSPTGRISSSHKDAG
jgi:hypothetical protein